MKTENLTKYTCDACGKSEYVDKKDSSPMQEYRLPMKYFDESGRQHGLTNEKVDLCSECAHELELNLFKHYDIYSMAYVGVTMVKRGMPIPEPPMMKGGAE